MSTTRAFSPIIRAAAALFVLLGTVQVSHAGTAEAQTASLSAPIRGSLDQRVVVFAYTPDVVFKLPVTVGMHTQIALADDEELVEIPRIGDKVRWRIEGNQHNLYVKASVAETVTSLSLVTTKRIYQFELSATTKTQDRIQMVSFSYPDQEEAIKVRAQRRADAERSMAEAATARLNAQNLSSEQLDPSQLKFLKVVTPNGDFARMHAYTDGVKTWMRMPDGIQDLPAVFMVSANARGKESLMPVNYTVVDRKNSRDRDVIVIDRTAPMWMLQIGQDLQVRVSND